MNTIEELIAEVQRLDREAPGDTWTTEPHGSVRALYAGRDRQHHGLRLMNLSDGDSRAQVTEETICYYRTACPALAAEVQRLRVDLATAAREYLVPCPESGTPMAILLSANILLRRGNERLRADLEEQRLTLAAEQGRQEGAPAGWFAHYDRNGFQWLRGDPNEPETADIGVHLLNGEWRWTEPGHESRPYPTARAAMQAADAAREPQ